MSDDVTVSEPYYKTDSGKKSVSETTVSERRAAATPDYKSGKTTTGSSRGTSTAEKEVIEGGAGQPGPDAEAAPVETTEKDGVTVSEPYYQTDEGKVPVSEASESVRRRAATPTYVREQREKALEPLEERVEEDVEGPYYETRKGKLPVGRTSPREKQLFRMQAEGDITEQERREKMGLTEVRRKVKTKPEPKKETKPEKRPEKSWEEVAETLYPRPGVEEGVAIAQAVAESPEGPSERYVEMTEKAKYFKEQQEKDVPSDIAEVQAANLAKLGVTREEFEKAQETERPEEVKEAVEGLSPLSEERTRWTESALQNVSVGQEATAGEIQSVSKRLNEVIEKRNKAVREKGAEADVSSYDKKIEQLRTKLSEKRVEYARSAEKAELPYSSAEVISKEVSRQKTKKRVWEEMSPYEKAYVSHVEGAKDVTPAVEFTGKAKGYAAEAISFTEENLPRFLREYKDPSAVKAERVKGVEKVREKTKGTVLSPFVSYVSPQAEKYVKSEVETRKFGGAAVKGAAASVPSVAAFAGGTLSVQEKAMREISESPEKTAGVAVAGAVAGPPAVMAFAPGVYGEAIARGGKEQAEAFVQDPIEYAGRSVGTAAALKGFQIVGKKGAGAAKKAGGKLKTKVRGKFGKKMYKKSGRYYSQKPSGPKFRSIKDVMKRSRMKTKKILPGEKKYLSLKGKVKAEAWGAKQKLSDIGWKLREAKIQALGKIPRLGEKGGFGAGRTTVKPSPKLAAGTKTLTQTVPKSLTKTTTAVKPSTLTFTTPLVGTEEMLKTKTDTFTVPQVLTKTKVAPKTVSRTKTRTKTRPQIRSRVTTKTLASPLSISKTSVGTKSRTATTPLTKTKTVSDTRTKTVPLTETRTVTEIKPKEKTKEWPGLDYFVPDMDEEKRKRFKRKKGRREDLGRGLLVAPPLVSAEIYEARFGGARQAPAVERKAADVFAQDVSPGVQPEFVQAYELQPTFRSATPESMKRRRGGGFLAPKSPLGEIPGMVPPKTKRKMSKGQLKGAPKGPKKQRSIFESRQPKTKSERKRFGHSFKRLGFRDVFKKPKKSKGKGMKGFGFEFKPPKINLKEVTK